LDEEVIRPIQFSQVRLQVCLVEAIVRKCIPHVRHRVLGIKEAKGQRRGVIEFGVDRQ